MATSQRSLGRMRTPPNTSARAIGTRNESWSKPTKKVSTLRSRKARPIEAISGATRERARISRRNTSA